MLPLWHFAEKHKLKDANVFSVGINELGMAVYQNQMPDI